VQACHCPSLPALSSFPCKSCCIKLVCATVVCDNHVNSGGSSTSDAQDSDEFLSDIDLLGTSQQCCGTLIVSSLVQMCPAEAFGRSVCCRERTAEETLSIYLPVRLNIHQLLGTISTLVIHTTSTYVMHARSYID